MSKPAPFIPKLDSLLRELVLSGVKDVPSFPTTAWPVLAEVAVRTRMVGAALAIAEAQPEDVPLEVLDHLRVANRLSVARTMVLEGSLREIGEILAAAETPWLLSKGPGLARLSPLLRDRAFGDLDVLVPNTLHGRATTALREAGFKAPLERWEPRRDTTSKYRHSISFNRDHVTIDLHKAIPPITFGRRLTFGRLMERSREVMMAGASVRMPDATHATIIAALHVISSGGGAWVRPWRDAVVLLRHANPHELGRELGELDLLKPVAIIAKAIRDEWSVPMPLLDESSAMAAAGSRTPRLWAMDWRRPWRDHQIAELVRMPAWAGVGFAMSYLIPDRTCLQARFPNGRSSAATYLRWWLDLVTRGSRALIGDGVDARFPQTATGSVDESRTA